MHVMIDVETLSLRPDAALLQIAAVEFAPILGGEIRARFNFNVSVDLFGQKRHTDTDTIDWWRQQTLAGNNVLIRSITGQDAMKLDVALDCLSMWWENAEPVVAVWAHGVAFDIAVLTHAYACEGKPTPWNYRAVRDTRTHYAAREVEVEHRETLSERASEILCEPFRAHDALHDVVMQALQVQSVMG